ncbi:tripartite tricarboxylate transporter TctB family protein [Salirhabdus salicampi]|uniref:tripartite tricarboxylate transporter TctB family protein n=1 Tax=Salirhabdus salicampi TaxID=476102 RepID=UPI0020C3F1E4|nr:tripartite tricarboxylate transporter TctB family protein [Salirhabdus salicampi]MCP8616177.1 tripartite tricarboxylate transporter TctB family protein [Salirhabdus salicampi]
MKLTTNRKLGLFVISFAAVYLILSYQLPSYAYTLIDADVVPKFLGWLLVFLGILLFISKDHETAEQKAQRNIPKKEVAVLLAVVAFIFLYIFLLEIIGFVITTVLFLFFCSRFLGYQNMKANILVSVLFPITIYTLFTYLLQISLPQGILPL